MADSADLNLLYQEWLDIPAERCPPNHYALLGVDDFESDMDAIELAAKSRGAYLHQIASGPNRKIVQDLLGQVAIARRTLLDALSKAQYDESLRNPVPDPISANEAASGDIRDANEEAPAVSAANSIVHSGIAPSGLAGSSSDTSPSSVTSPSSDTTRNDAPRRKKKSDLKYHFASAAVLLALVGLFAFFNRNKGGRHASQVQDASRISPRPSSDEPDSAPNIKALSGKESALRKKLPTSAAKSGGNPNRKSVAKPAEKTATRFKQPKNTRSSGLGGAMPGGAELDYSSVGSNATTKGGFVPIGGITKGPIREDIAKDDWPTKLTTESVFNEMLKDSFDCDQGFDWFTAKDDRLILKPKMKQANFLVSKKTELSRGQAVSLTTNISKGMSSEVRTGISIGTIQIGLKPSKNGVNVYVKETGGTDDSITTIENPSSPIQILIQRSPELTDRLNWFARSEEQIVAGYVDGSLDDQPAEVGIFGRGERKGRKQGPIISEWMVPSE